jgi:hypothetical protein
MSDIGQVATMVSGCRVRETSAQLAAERPLNSDNNHSKGEDR